MSEKTFGRVIRSQRTKLGFSQTRLGELVGRSPSTIRSWEGDKSRPNDPGVITALSAVLGVDERVLFETAGQEMPVIEESPTVEQALATLNPEAVAESEDESTESDDESTGLDDGPADSDDDQSTDLHDEPEPQVMDEPVPVPAPAYVAPADPYLITTTVPPLHEPSYMEDQSQRQLYRVRTLATIVILVSLGIAFLWALTQSFDAFVTWWDEFFGSLRL